MRKLKQTMSLRTHMTKSDYFRALIPYIGHMNDEQIYQLPKEYFKHNSDMNMVFRCFYEQYIKPMKIATTEDNEMIKNLRQNTPYDTVLDDVRRQLRPPQ